MQTPKLITPTAIQWLLDSDEPWTRYRTLIDLLHCPDEEGDVQAARAALLAHPQIKELMTWAASWPGYALTRHNDASHPIYALSTLADFGVRADDRGMKTALKKVLAHQSKEGAFQSSLNVSKTFGGTGKDMWAWMLCDAPTLLYSLLATGCGDDPRVQRAVDQAVNHVDENGWRCRCAPELGRFRGPGRKDDVCPIATVYALKALSQIPELIDSRATRCGVEALLSHWEQQSEGKHYLFGIGTDFRKLKYPFIWYDILHVVDVLSRFPFARTDRRFKAMLGVIMEQVGAEGRCTATSMYQAWKGWSFADKKQPSPWLTLLVLRLRSRMTEQAA